MPNWPEYGKKINNHNHKNPFNFLVFSFVGWAINKLRLGHW
jgi:hypothetical protein